MKVYAFIIEKSKGSFIVQLLREDGVITNCIEMKSWVKRKEIAQKFVHDGDYIEYLDNPWGDPGFKEAIRLYEVRFNSGFEGSSY